MEQSLYWLWLCGKTLINRDKVEKLLAYFGGIERMYNADSRALEQCGLLTQKEYDSVISRRKEAILIEEKKRLTAEGIGILYPGHQDYPEKLLELTDYPYILFYKGKLPKEQTAVSIVGARNCSSYGKRVAESLGQACAQAGIMVVSGMARGIDTCAHLGALAKQGVTCAVLGCGIRVCYPKENRRLYDSLSLYGCILSEYPPDTPPYASLFPQRNRIISGLSKAVVVVEAREKSGSLITVDYALEQGKDIYAVPGRMGDSLSEGCNGLIQNGAGILTKPEDLIVSLGGNWDLLREKKTDYSHNTSLGRLYNRIEDTPQSVDELMETTGLTLPQIFPLLLRLQLDEKITEVEKNCYVRKQ
jgi:DNA processing protein